MSGGFRELVAWQKAMALADSVYRATQQFPPDERYGLTSQVRRAIVSVASNIAEGNGRETLPDYLRHLSIAHGSLSEVDTQLELASRFGYLDQQLYQSLREEVAETGRVLNGLRRGLRKRLK